MLCVWLLFCSMILHQNDYVSLYPGTVTQIEAPAITLLAHDFADGQYFKEIAVGDEVFYLRDWYTVTKTRTIALQEIPVEIYDPSMLLLITCEGDGRLIVIAEK